MSLPDQMTDRWHNRPEPAPGEGVVSWHLLMRDYPEVVDLARRAQQRLAGFDGLHMTPLRWLHVTTLLAGPAADFSSDKLQQMTETAADLLASTPAPAVTLGHVLDDEAKRTYGDVASGQPRAKRVNDGLGRLARRAVADSDVRSPARGLARWVRPGDLMGRRARGVIDRRQPVGRCDAEHDGFGMVADLAPTIQWPR